MRRVSSITSLLSLGFLRRTSEFRTNVVRSYCHRSHLSLSKRPGPLMQYKNLVEQGKLHHDPYQERVALELENLLGRLEQYEKDMEEYHLKLAKWEENRENERRRILMEEAELKQQGNVWTTVNKHRNRFVERWMFRKRPENVEPGVGKWVSVP
ncbi:hypothetical protein L1049_014040 [Liquidambar formosana]|uniref:Uncharacterized protein n=1 Tax=Liquidambar formosana TaxID=63359 RepID=A0AAP0RR61_LIQFO